MTLHPTGKPMIHFTGVASDPQLKLKRLAMNFYKLTDQQQTMYDNEPWAKLVREIGLEPYHVEAQARRIAEHAVRKLDLCHKLIANLQRSRKS